MLYSIKIQYSPEYKPVVKYWSVQVFQRGGWCPADWCDVPWGECRNLLIMVT